MFKNYQKEVKITRNKLLTSLKTKYKNKPFKVPFSKRDIDEIHKIIFTYYNLSKDDLEIIIHNETKNDPYYFCLLNPLMINIKDEITKILEITTGLKWKSGVTLGCGIDGMKYSYYVSDN